ncbi:Glycosyltransferase, catalytic subunit of cellulose synthase and poly-beta-1,6-N-acetylglucosamine synthase [Modestobacter sp. DSM 44400]|uniref:glycosyltransferase family 2 protein n=1 Tax=Modestobacter sp. DSM 44400 TaxID=1550230 RepID=UPI00089ACAD4|nr:glycosyltransferase family 2 protein [Modestobacter sp. DSM 44400]SDY54351.1 Glycosyltransferase, catalytic subunit of cellulose synthase and poly-beta-1,6-N-acetylglucosamine synthase [Modestobacter sp. DSM 44400]
MSIDVHPQAPPASLPERRELGRLYGREPSTIAGELQPSSSTVRYRSNLSRGQRITVTAMGGLHMALAAALVVFLILPANLPKLSSNPVVAAVAVAGLLMMVGLQVIAGLRSWSLTYHTRVARDPIPMVAQPGQRVAVLTTIVPGKEPVELVMTTLRAMKRIRHDGLLDVWLLDEGNDPEVRRLCEAIGVKHFSRKGRAEWNTDTGPYRRKTKHGNHNSWRAEHEMDYDVVAQMDPDHVPYPHFLERTLGYFADPDTAFVVAPQVYGNLKQSFVARGAAESSYMFHGVVQRGGNGRQAPMLIGTNHLYRPTAFDQIGGYQDCIIEDHLTSIVLYTNTNPDTGNSWRGVYTPDILAVGEGPATYSDYFSQQKRWAYGVWEIVRQYSPRVLPKMGTKQQMLSFVALQLHYPITAPAWLFGVSVGAIYLVGGISVTQLPLHIWVTLLGSNLVLGFSLAQYLRRFNLAAHERRSWGLAGMVLDTVTFPIYIAAALAQLAGRPLTYVVTAKGSAATGDTWRTFRPHMVWLAVSGGSIGAGLLLDHTNGSLMFWSAVTAAICLTPMVQVAAGRLAALRADTVEPAGVLQPAFG